MLDHAELLINTSKGPDYMNVKCVPFASITNKLEKIAKIPYCCQRHLVYLKAQNILLKMAANFLEKGPINVDIGKKISQSVSDNMRKD